MAEMFNQKILEELKFVREKVSEIDKEIHNLREDFSDSMLSRDDLLSLEKARREYKEGKTKTLEQVRRKLKL